jgi:N-acetylated-alpha-linked acidic dipeptidase
VYHSLYDDFFWMKSFGDPTFEYHATLAKMLGTMALRLDEADVLPYDYAGYAAAISRVTNDLVSRASQLGMQSASLQSISDASGRLTASATRASHALQHMDFGSFDAAKQNHINHELASVEQALLAPEGLVGRPWYKHTIYAPGSYAGYAAEVLPGVNEALDRDDAVVFQQEGASLAAALLRASARLDEITKLAEAK